jgi:FdhE protein
MNQESIAHLKEIQELYRKVREFESSVTLKHTYNPVEKKYRHYRESDIDTVIDIFSEVFGLEPSDVHTMKDTMKSGGIDFFLYRTDEASLTDDNFAILYILSRPFFHAMKKSVNLDTIYWQEGRCPVCSGVPSLSLIEKEAQRIYFCLYCGSEGKYKRIGCPFCHNENSEKISIMYVPNAHDEKVRIDACTKCKSYVKTFIGLPPEQKIEERDIQTLPLDVVAQNKGYFRRSPNAVGMRKF